jgi:hypothetical protein
MFSACNLLKRVCVALSVDWLFDGREEGLSPFEQKKCRFGLFERLEGRPQRQYRLKKNRS